ncbi:hypothetical protein BRADI_1g47985v3 [Brachypodium distachyon]|uniref:Uncharacterized protein n=1 Tax=Brachypodium distachyon TaxID=15368 RepID=A0A0Q3JNR5_BRADI|nr:hypothetical protein BRADI_1g47985v3 [Brachypodium distachyon]
MSDRSNSTAPYVIATFCWFEYLRVCEHSSVMVGGSRQESDIGYCNTVFLDKGSLITLIQLLSLAVPHGSILQLLQYQFCFS